MAHEYRKITTSVAWQSIHFKGWSGRGGRGGNVEKKGSDNMVYNEMCIPQNKRRTVNLSLQKKRLWQHGTQWSVHHTKHMKDCWSFPPEEKVLTTWYTMKCASHKTHEGLLIFLPRRKGSDNMVHNEACIPQTHEQLLIPPPPPPFPTPHNRKLFG